jgi:hypothetical protein
MSSSVCWPAFTLSRDVTSTCGVSEYHNVSLWSVYLEGLFGLRVAARACTPGRLACVRQRKKQERLCQLYVIVDPNPRNYLRCSMFLAVSLHLAFILLDL